MNETTVFPDKLTWYAYQPPPQIRGQAFARLTPEITGPSSQSPPPDMSALCAGSSRGLWDASLSCRRAGHLCILRYLDEWNRSKAPTQRGFFKQLAGSNLPSLQHFCSDSQREQEGFSWNRKVFADWVSQKKKEKQQV